MSSTKLAIARSLLRILRLQVAISMHVLAEHMHAATQLAQFLAVM